METSNLHHTQAGRHCFKIMQTGSNMCKARTKSFQSGDRDTIGRTRMEWLLQGGFSEKQQAGIDTTDSVTFLSIQLCTY